MEYRELGRTGLHISEIGFGCGNTAGLMVSGTPEERRDGVARALELGINYFDTAPVYGDGRSETHLGQALKELGVRPIVATKVLVSPQKCDDIAGAVVQCVEESLRRLQLDHVDVVHLHLRVTPERVVGGAAHGMTLGVQDVLGPRGVVEGFERLRREGKARFFGFCGAGGDAASVAEVIDSGALDSIMVSYNLLNPTAGMPAPTGFEGADYGQSIDLATAQGMGAVVLRVLSAGALAGQLERHPLTPVRWMEQFQAQSQQAQRFRFLAEEEGYSMAQAAIRFGLSKPEVSTVLVGVSCREHIEEAASCSDGHTLSPGALGQLAQLYRKGFSGAGAE